MNTVSGIVAGVLAAASLAGAAQAQPEHRWGFALVGGEPMAVRENGQTVMTVARLFHSPIYDMGWVEPYAADVAANARFCEALEARLPEAGLSSNYGCRGGYYYQSFGSEAEARAAMWDRIGAWRRKTGSDRMAEIAAFNPVVPAPVEVREMAALPRAAAPAGYAAPASYAAPQPTTSYAYSAYERTVQGPTVRTVQPEPIHVYLKPGEDPYQAAAEAEARYLAEAQIPQTAALNSQVLAQSWAVDARNDAKVAAYLDSRATWQADVAARQAAQDRAQQDYAAQMAAWQRRVAACKAGVREACGS